VAGTNQYFTEDAEYVQVNQADYASLRAQLSAYERKAQESAEANLVEAAEATDAPEYLESDLVTVLLGWGRVGPTSKGIISGKSKAIYHGTGGVYRNVLYSDALYFQQNKSDPLYCKILPKDAHEAEFARATGVQPMELQKFAAMLEAVSLPDLLTAWGRERAIRWIERFTHIISQRQANGLS
jgi:hypothetical protein